MIVVDKPQLSADLTNLDETDTHTSPNLGVCAHDPVPETVSGAKDDDDDTINNRLGSTKQGKRQD